MSFTRLGTQWMHGPTGHVVGLRYEGVEAGLRMAGVEVTPQLFEDLQLMERAALAELRHRAERDRTR